VAEDIADGDRAFGRDLAGLPVTVTRTVAFVKAGMNRATGSSRPNLPCSSSIIAATDVIGLLIE